MSELFTIIIIMGHGLCSASRTQFHFFTFLCNSWGWVCWSVSQFHHPWEWWCLCPFYPKVCPCPWAGFFIFLNSVPLCVMNTCWYSAYVCERSDLQALSLTDVFSLTLSCSLPVCFCGRQVWEPCVLSDPCWFYKNNSNKSQDLFSLWQFYKTILGTACPCILKVC